MKLRINKLISDAGLGSRREVEDYIRNRRVRINGRYARLTDMVDEEDVVLLDEVDLPVKDLIAEHMALEKVVVHEKKKEDRPRTKSKKEERAESQRLFASPKSAALRKTSKNNPENRWKYRQSLLQEEELERAFGGSALQRDKPRGTNAPRDKKAPVRTGQSFGGNNKFAKKKNQRD